MTNDQNFVIDQVQVEAPPYPGAKNSFLIEDDIEDAEWLTELFVLTERELPAPKPKKKRTKKGSS